MSNFLTVISPAESAACCAPLAAQPLTMEQAEQVAPLLKALADPVRLRLMSLVASREGGEACVCDLNDAFDLSQPTISHHLKVLHEAGLVDRDKRGVWVYYRARPPGPGRARRPDRLPARDSPANAGLPFGLFIVYRRLTMDDAQPLDRQVAETYAAWFRALAQWRPWFWRHPYRARIERGPDHPLSTGARISGLDLEGEFKGYWGGAGRIEFPLTYSGGSDKPKTPSL